MAVKMKDELFELLLGFTGRDVLKEKPEKPCGDENLT